jgi:uncharacterized membrane protein YbhN (UPF0104 family)
MPPRLKRALNASILIAGLGFCVFALQRLQRDYPMHGSFSAGGMLLAACCAIVALCATAFAWQRYMKAFLGERLPPLEAMYQICVMQIGKYVPVMIGGFLARISANAGSFSTRRIVIATTVEQIGAMGSALVIGIDCYVVVRWPVLAPVAILASLSIVWFTPSLLAIISMLYVRLRGAFGMKSVAAAGSPDSGALRTALVFQYVQMLVMVVFVCTVILQVFPDLSLRSSALMAGAYLISIVAGIAVVFLPGGMGVREAVFVGLASGEIATAEALQLALALRIAMSLLDLAAGATSVALRVASAKADARPRP